MRTPSAVCRNGHKMAGKNLLWHTRYTKAGEKKMIRECRTCANARCRAKRLAAQRNLALEAVAQGRCYAERDSPLSI